MSTVWIAENVCDPSSWERHDDVASVNELVSKRWTALPAHTQIYWKFVAESCNVTPRGTEANIDMMADRLDRLDGVFFVMCYPADPITWIVVIAFVLAAVSLAATFLFRPNSAKPNSSQSPNNSLADRQNTARPNERINDIVGTVRATPDVIQLPYRVFIGNQEVEYGYYCVGRGSYTVSQAAALLGGATFWDIKEDTTPLQQIDGSSVAVYGPFVSPNTVGGTPLIQIGAAINQPVINITKSASVIGQILRAPNDTTLIGASSIRATSSGTLECTDSNVDFTAFFGAGDSVSLDGTLFSDPSSIQPSVSLAGIYVPLSVTSNVLTFAAPNTINGNWASLAAFGGSASNYVSPRLTETGERWVGSFIIDQPNCTEIWCNYVAPQGLFKVSADTGQQYRIDVTVELKVVALDANYLPVGSPRYFDTQLIGSASLQSQRASTLKAILPLRSDGTPASRVMVSSKRLSPYDPTWQGTNSDQVQWRDLYAVSPVTVPDFGNVTTIQTMSYATASALTTQQRKLNLEVTRNIPVRTPTSPFAPDLTYLEPSKNAADIACFIARDPFIGNRPDSEINFDDIYQQLGKAETRTISGATHSWVAGAVANYFGTPLCCEFCYTFDDTQTTFEEMMTDIGQAVFCTPYRRASVLTYFFEKLTANGTILFNHRNKLPGSETRTAAFGLNNDYDGIELDYIDPHAPNYPQIETTLTLYYPPDRSATNAKKIKLLGVRNNVQAELLGWRFYNKLLYQVWATEFKSTGEASTVINMNRILVADNTRPDTQDGEVRIVTGVGLTLTLSQPVTFITGKDYVIFIQNYDGTIENIPITAGLTSNQVILSRAPALPLVTDPNMYARTTYQIAGRPDSFGVVHELDVSWNGGTGVIDGAFDSITADEGDTITLTNVVVSDGILSNDISGTYTIDAISGFGTMYIAGVDWSFLTAYVGGVGSAFTGTIRTSVPGVQQVTPFLLTKKAAESGSDTFNIQAVNCDDRYYNNDTDFLQGVLQQHTTTASDVGFSASEGTGGGDPGHGGGSV